MPNAPKPSRRTASPAPGPAVKDDGLLPQGASPRMSKLLLRAASSRPAREGPSLPSPGGALASVLPWGSDGRRAAAGARARPRRLAPRGGGGRAQPWLLLPRSWGKGLWTGSLKNLRRGLAPPSRGVSWHQLPEDGDDLCFEPLTGAASPVPPSCAAGPAATSLSGIVLSLLPASVTGLLSSLGQGWEKPDTPGSQMARSEATWKLSDLELGATVGAGSFGRVRVAWVKDSPETTPMALKITHKATLIKANMVNHIKDEIKVLRMIKNHPYLVNLRACWQDERSMYMLMDFVNGGELFTVIKNWKIPEVQGQLWVAELILAIEHLHSKKVAHRDVKPENVLLDRLGHLVLTDFGFAKVADPLLWTKCGTYEYMAPEVVQKTGHGCAVDWWALGVLTYELFSCDVPFHADTKESAYNKIVKGEYSIPSSFPAEVQDLIRNLLKEESRRLGCMEDGVAGIKKHPWFSTIDFNEVLHRRVPSLCRPKVSSAEDTSRFKTYSESDFDDPPALSVEQQALFEFDVCEGRTKWDDSSERFLPGYGCCSTGGRKQDLVEFAEVNHR